jgi:histidinol dehydrogenase
MRRLYYPGPGELTAALERPAKSDIETDLQVRRILDAVRTGGDDALRSFTRDLDGYDAAILQVDPQEIEKAAEDVPAELKKALHSAAAHIEAFHRAGIIRPAETETAPGVRCWTSEQAIEKVGLYIPGGTAPLFSTVLMLAIPARLAGCSEIIMCTPPGRDGKINPLILYAASITGVKTVFRAGGAQAVAAMAYGTGSIPAVYKIFGPGNRYVTRAKEMVQLEGTAIDMPAGPSELLVIADGSANPSFVAADLLSQAEHGTDSQVIMLTDSQEILNRVDTELQRQLLLLPRQQIAVQALENSSLVLLEDIMQCIGTANGYAPEHLIIATADPYRDAARVRCAGSVFLGSYSSESTGDYMSGPNHTLPTGGYARSFSGISVSSFMKKIFFQEVTPEGLRSIGPETILLARAEMLDGHAAAVAERLKQLNDETKR